jgi:hypothetical protein
LFTVKGDVKRKAKIRKDVAKVLSWDSNVSPEKITKHHSQENL